MSESNIQSVCATCRFYRRAGEEKFGACRRYPPVHTGQDMNEEQTFEFPWVAEQCWCGEYVPVTAGQVAWDFPGSKEEELKGK